MRILLKELRYRLFSPLWFLITLLYAYVWELLLLLIYLTYFNLRILKLPLTEYKEAYLHIYMESSNKIIYSDQFDREIKKNKDLWN